MTGAPLLAPGPSRIQRSRAKGARLPAGAVIVDRTTFWGNPWAAGDQNAFRWPDMPHPPRLWRRDRYYTGRGRMTAAETVATFRRWLVHDWIDADDLPSCHPAGDAELDLYLRRGLVLGLLFELRGRDLACWCHPASPCHADILLELANA